MIYINKRNRLMPKPIPTTLRNNTKENHIEIPSSMSIEYCIGKVFQDTFEDDVKNNYYVDFKRYLHLVIIYLSYLMPNATPEHIYKMYCAVYSYLCIYYKDLYLYDQVDLGGNYDILSNPYSESEIEMFVRNKPLINIDITQDIPFEISLARYLAGEKNTNANEVAKTIFKKAIRSEMVSYYFGLTFKKRLNDYPEDKKQLLFKLTSSYLNVEDKDRDTILTMYKEYCGLFDFNHEEERFVYPDPSVENSFIDTLIEIETRPDVFKFGRMMVGEFSINLNSHLVSVILDNKDNKEFLDQFKL